MIKEVKMYKTTDGQTFEDLNEAEETQRGLDKERKIESLRLMVGRPYAVDTVATSNDISLAINFVLTAIVEAPESTLKVLGYDEPALKQPDVLVRLEDMSTRYVAGPQHLHLQDLVEICEAAFVPEETWSNRDSATAQEQLGHAYAYLRAGCHFEFQRASKSREDNSCTCDNDTLWLKIYYKGFGFFEHGSGDNKMSEIEEQTAGKQHETFYLPTPVRLLRSIGKDWY